MIKKVFTCDGDGCSCPGWPGWALRVAANEEELKRQLDRSCIRCNKYEEVEPIDTEDGKYVIVAVKIDG